MLRASLSCLTWVGLLAAATGLFADDPAPQFDPQTMMRADEVRVGMRGTGKSVFRGVEITEFGVEVLGILPKTNLGGDLVLIRVLDGPVVDRGAGVIGGMSGSPIYVDGRLLGAVAYTWSFEKEPIGGVTPIESMLEAYVEPAEAEKAARAPVELHGRRLARAHIASVGERQAFADGQTINLVPVGQMTCAGMTGRCLGYFGEFLKPYGIEPVAGPGGLREPVDADLVPGAGVAVDLMRGDFEASMIGTVTYRRGDSVLAFGHPMMQLGAVDLPLATAYIHEFIPSYSRGDKMGSSMRPVGALRRDGAWSVGGLVGAEAPMVPVDMVITDETTGRSRSFHVDVAKEETLTRGLVSLGVSNAVEAGFRPMGEGTARVRFEVEGERGARVTRENIFYDSSAIGVTCTQELSSTLYVLRRNPFEPQEAARVRVDVSLSDKNSGAVIEEVYTDETVAKAGEKLTVHVVLRPWDGETFEKVVELTMPQDLQRGQMRIGICGGDMAYGLRERLGLLQPDFHDLPSIIEDLQKMEYGNQLFVAAALPNTGLGVAQYLLHRLPSSVAAIMGSSRTTNLRGGKEEISSILDCDHVILGQGLLTLATEDKTGARAATPPPSAPTPAGGPSGAATATDGLRERAVTQNPMTAAPLRWVAVRQVLGWSTASGPADPAVGQPAKPDKGSEPSAKSDDGGEEEGPETDAEEEEEEDRGPLSRRLSEWRQTEAKDFEEGEAEGLAIRSDGTLYVPDRRVGEWLLEERRGIWSAALDGDGALYYGTGLDGRIHRLGQDRKPELVHDTGQLAVHALSFSGPNLYAGTIPDGKLLRLDPKQADSAQLVADLPDDYIWALLPDGSGGVFAGTGSHGRLYHVTAAGEATQVAQLPAQHVLCLARLGDDLLAGTAENGVVYRVSQDGRFTTVYDDDDPAVTGLAATAAGEVYACTSQKGHVVRITPGKEARQVAKLDPSAATTMVAVGETVYVGTSKDGSVLALLDADNYAVVGKLKASEVTCLAASGTRLVAAAVNPGRLAEYDTGAEATGTFESAVLDGERTARWGNLLWTGDVPAGAEVTVQARAGQSADPDDGTWTGWSAAFAGGAAQAIGLGPSRYLQYRVQMKKAQGGAPPALRSLVVSYLPANRKPEVKLTDPKDGSAVSGKVKLKWEGKDPDDDSLRYAVHVRPSGGTEWRLVKDGLKDPELEWDTKAKDVSEGIYAVRVTATDALSRPGEALAADATAFPVSVDNAPPRLRQQGETVIGEDKAVAISGTAWDTGSAIAGIEFRIGKQGDWQSVAARDGLFDSLGEGFDLRTAVLDPGEQTVTIRVRDAAGNKTDLQVKVTIPGEPKKDEEGAESKPPPGKPRPVG